MLLHVCLQGTGGYSGMVAAAVPPDYQAAGFDYMALGLSSNITWGVRKRSKPTCVCSWQQALKLSAQAAAADIPPPPILPRSLCPQAVLSPSTGNAPLRDSMISSSDALARYLAQGYDERDTREW